ncbi:hypothetical protein SAMN05216233_101612 [Desulfoluna spongiiphila]|uniref:Lipoprotein n=1 Tax=Desulfoluna spongiiphila TaxID=419481 RepID=A0A1G5B3Z5_9BACT|nr:hypothetical protein SAMN05216233_101612 [Desulfoluna spongiiphila]
MFRNVIGVLVLIFCAACVSSAPAPLNLASYEGEKPLYPAVLKAFYSNKAPLEEIDVYNDYFRSGYIYRYDLLIKNRFKLKVELVNNTVDVQIIGLQFLKSGTEKWKDHTVTLGFDQEGFCNTISHAITTTLNDPNEYNSVKRELLEYLPFNYCVLKDLTDAGRVKWLKENMEGRIYDLDFNMVNVTDNTAPENMRYYTEGDPRYTAYLDWNSDNVLSGFSISMQTNDEKFALMKKGSSVKTKAVLLSGRNSQFTDRILLRLKEITP